MQHSSVITASNRGGADAWRTPYTTFLLFVLCYTDTPLNAIGGSLLSPAFAVLAPVIAVGHVLRRRRDGWEWGPLDKAALLALLWCNLVGVVHLLWYATAGSYDYLGESFVGKLIKLNFYYGFLYIAYRHLRATVRDLSLPGLATAFVIVLLLQFGVLIVEAIMIPDALNALHGGEQSYNRIRLLTPEASTSGSVVVVLVCGALALRGQLARPLQLPVAWLSFAFLLSYSLLGQSKGYLLVVGGAVLVAGVVQGWRRRSFLRIALGISVGGIAMALLAPLALGNLDSVIRDTSTVVTRGTLLLAALGSFAAHPWGSGFGPHEHMLSDAIPGALARVSALLPEASNFLELDSYATNSTGLFPKTGMAETLLLGGFVAGFAAWRAIRHLASLTKDDLWLRLALIFSVMALVSYINVLNKYELVILAVLIERIANERQAEDASSPRTDFQ